MKTLRPTTGKFKGKRHRISIMKKSSPRVKKVKAWAIVNRKDRSDVHAAYTDSFQARAEKKEHPQFHKNDVVISCEILIPTKGK